MGAPMWALATACGALLAFPSVAAALTFGGNVGSGRSCTYSVQADEDSPPDPSSGSFTGAITCPGNASPSVSGTWSGTSVTLSTLTVKLGDRSFSQDVGQTFSLPVDPTADVKAFFAALAQQVLDQFASALPDSISSLATSGPDGAAAVGKQALDVLDQLNQLRCYGSPGSDTPTNGDPTCHALPQPKPPGPQYTEEPTSLNAMSDEASKNDAGACPALDNNPPPKLFVICVPVYLAGEFDAGKKDILMMPGGAIVAAPIGASLSAPATPVIKTSGSMLVLGGAISGVNLKIEAKKNVEFAGAFVTMLDSLEIEAGKSLQVGQVDTKQVLGYVPGLIKDQNGWVGKGLNQVFSPDVIAGVAALVPSLKLGATLWAQSMKLQSGAATVATHGVISTTGFGFPGASFYGTGIAPGGSGAGFGGSHGGLGGYPDNSSFADSYILRAGRAKTFDDPFNPTMPGGGGGGADDTYAGNSGGGVISLTSSSLKVDGVVRSDGGGTGTVGGGEPDGGGGAGGTVNVTTGKLSGAGAIEADGGGTCPDCVNSFGGLGGGGMIAVRYTSDKLKVQPRALGGHDLQTHPNVTQAEEYALRSTAGAGTVFELQTKKGPSAPKVGKGKAADVTTSASAAAAKPGKGSQQLVGGTLIIDDGSHTIFPFVDATVLPDSWSKADRTLVIGGGARVYAADPKYQKIQLTDHAILTTDPALPAGNPHAQHLNVTAREIDVEKTARIDMTGRGDAGGAGDPGSLGPAKSPGAKPASGGWGGSHGGLGGPWDNTAIAPGAGPGTTYDSPTNPRLPGAGGAAANFAGAYSGSSGGGVIMLVADTLKLAGVIAANGMDTGGPSPTNPEVYDDFGGAGGAGGAIQLHVATLSGSGLVQADGGNVCLLAKNTQPSELASCGGSDAGGGGGGLILIKAKQHRGYHGRAMAAGGVNQSDTGTGNRPGGKGVVTGP
ncbi:MAG: hypothetical protein ACYC91_08310 [Solirubrobacteraceae bacterium]